MRAVALSVWSSLYLLAGCGSHVEYHLPPGDSDCSAPTTEAGQFECQLLQFVNQQRAAGAICGGQTQPAVGPLTMHPILHQVARVHAADMAQRNYFDHNTPEGATPFDRMTAAGYSYSTAGENIAATRPTPAETMQQWMQSTGHCQNIMRAAFADFGAGYAYSASSEYQYYWVQEFGAP